MPPPHRVQRKVHLEDTVVHVEYFQAYYLLDVDTGQANSRPLGSVAGLPFLPKGVLDLYDAAAVVQSTEKAIQPAVYDSPRASSRINEVKVGINTSRISQISDIPLTLVISICRLLRCNSQAVS